MKKLDMRLALITVALPFSLSAQEVREPTESESAPAEEAALEEVIVTAQKRSESLQKTPISIEAFNADQLATRGIDGLGDLGSNVPGMTVDPFPTSNASLRFFIRGIGLLDAQVTQDPPVGVYIDGVYIARSTGNAFDVADLERIEVLRGPQGTLYGRNTTGGAVNLVTRRPSTDGFSMSHKFGLGERNIRNLRSSINVPLADDLAVKLAVLASNVDGYVRNDGPGEDFGDRDDLAGRFDLRWKATESLTVDYSYDRSRSDYTNYLYQAVLPPDGDKGAAELFKRYAQSQSVYSRHRLKSLATGAPLEESRVDIEGHAATFTLALGEHELKYIGAHRELDDAAYTDLGGGAGSTTYRLDSNVYDGPAAQVANGGPTELMIPRTTQKQWSHELQLSGLLFDDSLQYIVGGFYFSEKAKEDRKQRYHQFSSNISPELIAPLEPLLGGLLNPRLVNFDQVLNSIDNEALAFYTQGTWTPQWLDERLHLTLGYRHSEDKREALKFRVNDTYLEGSFNGFGTAVLLSSADRFDNVRAKRKFSDDAITGIVAFDIDRDINVYAKYAEAYKSGGFNTRDPQISGESGPASDGIDYGYGFVEGFAPERVNAYELGVKSEWLEHRLRVNADVFYSDYTDMQINFLISGTVSDTKVANAGKARMRGFELETTLLAAPGLLLSLDYAYLDADVTQVRNISGEDVTGEFSFVSAPPHSFVAAIDWTMLDRSWGVLRGNLNYNYTDDRKGSMQPGKEGMTAIGAYGVLGARLSLGEIAAGSRGKAEIALWARNLLDKEYVISAIDNQPHADRAVLFGEPRTIGAELIYRWQ